MGSPARPACRDSEMAARRELPEKDALRHALDGLARRPALTQRRPLLRFSWAQTARGGLLPQTALADRQGPCRPA